MDIWKLLDSYLVTEIDYHGFRNFVIFLSLVKQFPEYASN
jgi:hypothetical protein